MWLLCDPKYQSCDYHMHRSRCRRALPGGYCLTQTLKTWRPFRWSSCPSIAGLVSRWRAWREKSPNWKKSIRYIYTRVLKTPLSRFRFDLLSSRQFPPFWSIMKSCFFGCFRFNLPVLPAINFQFLNSDIWWWWCKVVFSRRKGRWKSRKWS